MFTNTRDDVQRFPSLAKLSHRDRDQLAMRGAALSEDHTRLFELGQNLERGSPRGHTMYAPCVCPNQHVSRARLASTIWSDPF